MSAALLPAAWQDAVASVAHAYAVAARVGANHAPGSIEDGQFSDAAALIGDAVIALVATPAPDLAAVRSKLNLLADEFGGAESVHLNAIAEDLLRIGQAQGEFDPACWLADFEAVGGGFVIAEAGVQICVMLHGYPPSANREAKRLFDLINGDPVRQEAVKGLILARNRAALAAGENA